MCVCLSVGWVSWAVDVVVGRQGCLRRCVCWCVYGRQGLGCDYQQVYMGTGMYIRM